MARIKRFIASILRFPIPVAMGSLAALLPLLSGFSSCDFGGVGFRGGSPVCRSVGSITFSVGSAPAGTSFSDVASTPFAVNFSGWVPADMRNTGFGSVDTVIDMRLVSATFTASGGLIDFNFIDGAQGYLGLTGTTSSRGDGGWDGDGSVPDAGGPFATRQVLNYSRTGDASSPLTVALSGDFDVSDILHQGPAEIQLFLSGVVPESGSDISVGLEICVSFSAHGTVGTN